MTRSRHRAGILSCLVALGVAALPSGRVVAGDRLFYVVEEERVVFTNLPTEAGAVPLPGYASTARAAARPSRKKAHLPGTIYDPFIERVAVELGLAPELIKAVAHVESGFDPHATSPKGAQGLMQLMPATARQYGVRDAFDPLENLRGGSQHLRVLLDEFGGDLTLALAAYNAGSGAVRRHGGVPAYRETVNYVRRVQERLGPARRVTAAAEPAPAPIRLVPQADGTLLVAN